MKIKFLMICILGALLLLPAAAGCSTGPDTSLTFLFFSDTQPDPETGDFTNIALLLKQAIARDESPELIIFGGDTVNHGDDADWSDFWQAVGDSLDEITTAAVAGNHDIYTVQRRMFDHPSPKIQTEPGDGWNYSFSQGPVFFVMLDSNYMGAANTSDIKWLENELKSDAARQAHWRIAVMHHPMWTVSEIPRDIQRAETMREHFLPIFEEFGIDLILCGHQHVYSRTLPMRGDSVTPDGHGIVQIMAASGDKHSYSITERDFIAASAQAPNYLLLTADENSLNIIAYDNTHTEIDSYTIDGTSSRTPGIPGGIPAVVLPGDEEPGDDEPVDDDDENAWRINITDTSGNILWSFTERKLNRLPQEQACAFSHAYSTINNWPAARFYAADGYTIEGILKAAGVLETAQRITFRAPDGYEASLTREQLLSPQFYYPNVRENDTGALPVKPLLAYRWREGSTELNDIDENKPTLIFGQRNPFEHTSPAFVANISEIIVDDTPAGAWAAAGTFPQAGVIAAGETVKLQHPFYGLVKLHYTLDGSDPTPLSPMYNPSTYQPELNVPIPITEPVTIKVLVTGYGRDDSDIAVFEFMIAE